MSSARIGSYAALGAGTAGALAGVGLGLLAQGSATSVNARLVDGKLREGDASGRQLFRQTETQRGQALIAGGIGGALLVTGALLYAFGDAEAPAVSAALSHQSASLSISANF